MTQLIDLYNYASSLPLRVVLVRVPSRTFLSVLWQILLTRPSLFQTKVLVATRKQSSFLLASLSPKETRKATRASKGSGPRARPGINGLLGFQGCWVFSPARTLSRLPASRLPRKGVRRSRGQGLREDPPDLRPPRVRKHRGTSPEKKINKSNGNCFVFTCLGIQGCILLRALSQNRRVQFVTL